MEYNSISADPISRISKHPNAAVRCRPVELSVCLGTVTASAGFDSFHVYYFLPELRLSARSLCRGCVLEKELQGSFNIRFMRMPFLEMCTVLAILKIYMTIKTNGV
uniref:Uncharacterized protein n=1 Tax=Helianthus annuus TaxID=4232 RepID=A0A251UGH3_HELAN